MFEPLPALIRLQREAQGLTIDALSALARVSRTRLIALEKGEDNISLELLVKIANALQMTELRIGALRVTGATPEFNAAVAAAEAIQATRKIMDHVVNARAELDRVAGPVSAALSPVITSGERGTASPEPIRPKAAARRRSG